MGENGAGKTTLMSVLAGVVAADAGEIRIHGKPVRIDSVEDAYAHGIGMVHQHFRLFRALTVAENIVMGREPRRRGGYDHAAAEELVAQGRTVLFISHKLREVLEVSDTVTVMRRGQVTGTRPAAETDARELTRLMFGFAYALAVRLQGSGIPPQFVSMLPYVLTIIALVLLARRGRVKVRVGTV